MKIDLTEIIRVSIPSRRVGDSTSNNNLPAIVRVSIPSRRVGDGLSTTLLGVVTDGFHPLKAGRRLVVGFCSGFPSLLFPSPQGGSETKGK